MTENPRMLAPERGNGEEREAFLTSYLDPGELSPGELGLGQAASRGVVLPTAATTQFELNPRVMIDGRILNHTPSQMFFFEYPPGSGTMTQCFESVPFGDFARGLRSQVVVPTDRQRRELAALDDHVAGEFMQYGADFAFAAAEGNHIANGSKDMLAQTRHQLAYRLVELLQEQPLWGFAREGGAVEDVVRRSLQYFPIRELSRLERVYDDKQLQDVISLQAYTLAYLRSELKEKPRAIYHALPEVAVGVAAYTFATLKSGITNPKSDEFSLEDHELKPLLITLAQIERSPEMLDSGKFEQASSEFSRYLNLALDMGVLRLAPHAFALGNRALLDALGMLDNNYMERMYATNQRVSLESIGLSKLNETIQELNKEDNLTKGRLFASKSVFTGLSEALFKRRGEFLDLLDGYGLAAPERGQSQYAIDLDSLEKLDVLINRWMQGDQSEKLDVFLQHIYDEMLSTADIVRGTVFVPDARFDGIVDEARGREDIDVQLILNRQERAGARPEIVDLKTSDITEVRDLLDVYYGVAHTNERVYGAVHIYADSEISLGGFSDMQGSTTKRHQTEVRLVPESCARPFLEARLGFKGENSDHVREV